MTMPNVMTEYPATRRITWYDDETNEQVGQCEYIRADISEELALATQWAVDNFHGQERDMKYLVAVLNKYKSLLGGNNE